MSNTPQIDEALRAAIISHPDLILEDQALMQALVSGTDRVMGNNIVDLRGIAMDRLENRLDRLEDTHRSVIAAAYENVAGTNQVHRAVLRLLEPVTFDSFLEALDCDVAGILRIDQLRLVLETTDGQSDPALAALNDVIAVAPPGYIDSYLKHTGGPSRQVNLRRVSSGDDALYADISGQIRSEACLRLDLGAGRLPGLLVMGTADPEMFVPGQGTDLLEFFACVFERCMRRWLA